MLAPADWGYGCRNLCMTNGQFPAAPARPDTDRCVNLWVCGLAKKQVKYKSLLGGLPLEGYQNLQCPPPTSDCIETAQWTAPHRWIIDRWLGGQLGHWT
jgi:hypothetical protein